MENLIPRNSPEIDVSLSGEPVTLTWYNTALYIYDEPYDFINHIFIQIAEEEYQYVFNCEEIMDTLFELNFPVHSSVEPARGDIEAYIQYQEQLLEKELNNE